ncbi:hypothetical protein AB0D67_22475 [Streptosporangium sp. NPDC048047]|uniref:hypothetical protein n=1 Tax=Streptosporangium sp. NPDC048047 TaxID=3155748 RepID=UPI003433FDDD
MRTITTSLLAGSLLLAAACGVEQGGTAASVTTTAPAGHGAGTATGPSQPVSHTVPPVAPRDESTHGTPKPVRPEGHTVNPRKARWLTAKPSKDGRSLRVVWWSGVEPCTVLDRVSVKETARRVTVTLWEGPSSKAQNVACIDIAVKKMTTVKLKAPLGKRKVVDGAR